MLASDHKNFRPLALVLRKASLARLLSRPVDGIFIAECEQGDIGDVLFRVACNKVSRHRVESPRRAYSAGKVSHWLKVKNTPPTQHTAG